MKALGFKEEMLKVLKYPELPLHNNGSELEVRADKRRQDVSLQTKTEEGTKAKDTFLTITQTAKKLGVSAYEYIYDRISRQFSIKADKNPSTLVTYDNILSEIGIQHDSASRTVILSLKPRLSGSTFTVPG